MKTGKYSVNTQIVLFSYRNRHRPDMIPNLRFCVVYPSE